MNEIHVEEFVPKFQLMNSLLHRRTYHSYIRDRRFKKFFGSKIYIFVVKIRELVNEISYDRVSCLDVTLINEHNYFFPHLLASPHTTRDELDTRSFF